MVRQWLCLKSRNSPWRLRWVLSDAPTGLRPRAQGCRFGYPG